MEIETIGSPPHSESINGKWVGESNIDLIVVKGLGLLSNPHKIARLPLTTPRLKDFLIKMGETSNYLQNYVHARYQCKKATSEVLLTLLPGKTLLPTCSPIIRSLRMSCKFRTDHAAAADADADDDAKC